MCSNEFLLFIAKNRSFSEFICHFVTYLSLVLSPLYVLIYNNIMSKVTE